MIVRSREDRQATFPDFYLSGTALSVCSEVTYLGHIIVDDLSWWQGYLQAVSEAICSSEHAMS